MFQRVRCVWLKWRRKTKRLHRLTFGLLLGLVEAPVVYMGLTGGYIAFLLVLGVVLGLGRMVAEATFLWYF